MEMVFLDEQQRLPAIISYIYITILGLPTFPSSMVIVFPSSIVNSIVNSFSPHTFIGFVNISNIV